MPAQVTASKALVLVRSAREWLDLAESEDITNRSAFDEAIGALIAEASALGGQVDRLAAAKRSRKLDPVDLLARAIEVNERGRAVLDAALVAAVDKGVTLTDVGAMLGGVSRQRAGQVIAAAQARIAGDARETV